MQSTGIFLGADLSPNQALKEDTENHRSQASPCAWEGSTDLSAWEPHVPGVLSPASPSWKKWGVVCRLW